MTVPWSAGFADAWPAAAVPEPVHRPFPKPYALTEIDKCQVTYARPTNSILVTSKTLLRLKLVAGYQKCQDGVNMHVHIEHRRRAPLRSRKQLSTTWRNRTQGVRQQSRET